MKPGEEYEPRFRYRVYRVRAPHKDPEWVACAGCPDAAGIGVMLTTLHEDGEVKSSDALGILDTEPRQNGIGGGRWLINPYARFGR